MRITNADLNYILDHTTNLYQELRGERIFITGGTGFFGCWLLESLVWANERLNLNCRAFILTRSPDAFRAKAPHLANHRSISLVQGDVRTFNFPAGEFSHIIHAATESSAKLNSESPLAMFDTIVEGTRHTLNFAKACGAQNFLLTSSGAVYGRQPPKLTHVPEEYNGAPDPLDPKSAYGEGKRVAEYLCALYADTCLKPKIARCFAFVGPYLPLDMHFAIGNFLNDAMKGGPIIIKGDGTAYRSYLYAADLVIWLWTILLDGESCRPYNVGSEEALSVAEVAETVANMFSQKITIERRETPHPDRPTERYVPSTARARRELGLGTLIPIREGLKRTINYHQTREQD